MGSWRCGRFVRGEASPGLELDVGAEGGRRPRAAVAVVAGIVDVLHAGGEINSAPDVHGVVGLEDIFAAVGEVAVAEEKAEASGGEIVLVIFLDGVADEGDAGAVLLAMPPRAVRAHAFGEGLIDFGVGEGFGLAVVPSEAGEGGEVVREILLEVDAESVLARDVPGMVGDVGSRCLAAAALMT